MNFVLGLVMVLGKGRADCPVVNCSNSQDIGVCAALQNGQVMINPVGCTATTFCQATELLDWYNNKGSYIYCKEFSSPNTPATMNCGTRNDFEGLKDGIHPKRCNSISDCELLNGELSACECGMDGFMYCMPQWGSEVFDSYWDWCELQGMNVSYGWWQYFASMHDYYNYYIAAPDCAMNIFWELQGLQSFPSAALTAGIVALGIIMF
jgi:hypothetical protein